MSTGIKGRSPLGTGGTRLISGVVVGCLLLTMLVGCSPSEPENAEYDPGRMLPALRALGVDDGNVVVARGKLEPAGGVIAITAPPGNRLLRLDVAEGDQVEASTRLGELDSLQARQIERAVAKARLAEAKSAFKAKQDISKANLEVARIGLQQAELLVAHAESDLRRANQPDGRLGLLEREVQLAKDKLKQLRDAADDPTTEKLVSQATIDKHQLSVDQSTAELKAARVAAEQKIESGKLAVSVAKKEIVAAEVAVQAGRESASFASMERQLELLDLQVKASELVSPSAGRVVSIGLRPGEATTGMPVMHIADTREMECRAEINVADLPRIKAGAPAKVSSPALPRVLSGRIKSISQIVGSPSLPTANPLAPVDWRSVEVVISIDGQDNQAAAKLINLQVDVAIKAIRTDEEHAGENESQVVTTQGTSTPDDS